MCQECGCTPCEKCGAEIDNGVCTGCNRPASECECETEEESLF